MLKVKIIIAALAMLITSVCINHFSQSDDQPLKQNFSNFPLTIEQWQGAPDRFDEKIYQVLGVDDSILVNYRTTKSGTVQLYVGYYKSQRQGGLIHSPKNCMPGAGWNITDIKKLALNVPGRQSTPLNVAKIVVKKGVNRQVALFWFHSRGRVVTSEYWEKIYLVWDAITRKRTDGSFVRLLSPVVDNDIDVTIGNLKQFAEQLFPLLDEFIPD